MISEADWPAFDDVAAPLPLIPAELFPASDEFPLPIQITDDVIEFRELTFICSIFVSRSTFLLFSRCDRFGSIWVGCLIGNIWGSYSSFWRDVFALDLLARTTATLHGWTLALEADQFIQSVGDFSSRTCSVIYDGCRSLIWTISLHEIVHLLGTWGSRDIGRGVNKRRGLRLSSATLLLEDLYGGRLCEDYLLGGVWRLLLLVWFWFFVRSWASFLVVGVYHLRLVGVEIVELRLKVDLECFDMWGRGTQKDVLCNWMLCGSQTLAWEWVWVDTRIN